MRLDPSAGGLLNTRMEAVLVAGDLMFGVSPLAVEQVLPCPASLARLPRASECLAGVLSFRGRAVPVVSLNQWHAGAGAPTEPHTHVAVLTDGERRLGLLIHQVRGLARIQPDLVQRIHHDDDPNEFFHSVAPLDDSGTLLSLLDPGRLMRRAQAWSSGALGDGDATATTNAAGNTGKAEQRTDLLALLRLGTGWYGLPAMAVAELIARPSWQAWGGQGTELLGMMRWRERDIPVVHPAMSLGLETTAEPAPWMVIVQGQGTDEGGDPLTIAIPCHDMGRVRSFPASQVQACVSDKTPGAPACSGLVLEEDGRIVRLVDTRQLMGQVGMRLQAASGTRSETDADRPVVRNRLAHVVFQARMHLAAPIDQLQEIVPLPADFKAHAATGSDSTVGTIVWRQRVVPVVDLQRHLWPGEPLRTEHRRILITEQNGEVSGLLVGEVELLIPPNSGVITRMDLPGGRTLNMITVTQDHGQTSYRLIDFNALPSPTDTAPR
jgi:chemotaxis signal transduction protein